MLEIFFLIWFGRRLATIARSKGRSGAWAVLGVGLWVGGEVIGFVIGSALGMEMGAYGVGIASAIGGALIAWLVVSQLPEVGGSGGGGPGVVWPK
jgi:hypothetical protein